MIASTLALAATLLAPVAPADNEGADAQARVSAQEYIFVEGDSLEGETLSPGDTHIRARVDTKFPTMVLIRANFVDRIADLTNDM